MDDQFRNVYIFIKGRKSSHDFSCLGREARGRVRLLLTENHLAFPSIPDLKIVKINVQLGIILSFSVKKCKCKLINETLNCILVWYQDRIPCSRSLSVFIRQSQRKRCWLVSKCGFARTTFCLISKLVLPAVSVKECWFLCPCNVLFVHSYRLLFSVQKNMRFF